jgi:senataxin
MMKAPNSLWNIRKIGNVSTTLREWTALMRLQDIALLHPLLNPFRLSVAASRGDRRELALRQFLPTLHRAAFNESQVNAIKVRLMPSSCQLLTKAVESFVAQYAVSGTGFRLVQGPPGTGKTRTIVGMLSTLRHVAVNTLPNHAVSAVEKVEPLHFLVCAPSNAAVDEIVLRIQKLGLWDSSGTTYHPSVVRVVRASKPLFPWFIITRLCRELSTVWSRMSESAALMRLR